MPVAILMGWGEGIATDIINLAMLPSDIGLIDMSFGDTMVGEE